LLDDFWEYNEKASEQGWLLRFRIFIRLLLAQQSQTALKAEPQHLTLLRVAEFHPVETLIPAAQATNAIATRIYLADTATGTGYGEKLKLFSHSDSS